LRNNYCPSRNVHNDIRHAKGNCIEDLVKLSDVHMNGTQWKEDMFLEWYRGSFRSKDTEHIDLIYMLPMELKEINGVVQCQLLSKNAFTLYRNCGNKIVVMPNILCGLKLVSCDLDGV
jgi:hypothetical protein